MKERIRNRRRNQLSAVAAVAVIGAVSGGAVALNRMTNGGNAANKDLTTLSTISHAGLQLSNKVQHAPNDNRLVTIDEVLTGRSTATARYGWIVYWGDGGYDRAYGSSNCGDAGVHDVSDEHVFDHRYAHGGNFTVRVQVTLCGHQQLQWTGSIGVR